MSDRDDMPTPEEWRKLKAEWTQITACAAWRIAA